MILIRNSFVLQSNLHDVMGRIDYISNPKRQEHLYTTYSTVEPLFWKELAEQNQYDFKRVNRETGKCIEARELVIALPECLTTVDRDMLLQLFVEKFRELYGVQCTAALHHNKTMTNYHIHLIYSERKLLPQKSKKYATRNMFYDENHRHVRTKKEILDADGNIREGCYIIPKGEIYDMSYFSPKNEYFKSPAFLKEVKKEYTDLINSIILDPNQHLSIFNHDGPYLAMKKVGNRNPKAQIVEVDNELRRQWNSQVDMALVQGVTENELIELKKEEVTAKVSQSVKQKGNQPQNLVSILVAAINLLRRLIYLINRDSGKPIEVPAELKASSKNQEVIDQYEKMKPVQQELWKMTKSKRWYLQRMEEMQAQLDAIPEKDVTKLSEKIKLKNQIEYKRRQVAALDLQMNAKARTYGYPTVRDATTAYWRAKDALDKLQKQSSDKQHNKTRPSVLAELRAKQEAINTGKTQQKYKKHEHEVR